MNPVHAGRFWRCVIGMAFSIIFDVIAFAAVADAEAPQAPLALTEADLAGVIDPLMEEWIVNHKGPGAVVVVVTRDGPVFAKGYGFADVEARKFAVQDMALRQQIKYPLKMPHLNCHCAR
jgi:CubicO group peptidase (beta-lactamase class C family)